ncbi:MAG: hypothetical protein ABSF46_00450 [Terriglobia bacterium]|jgi:hypothetical protein
MVIIGRDLHSRYQVIAMLDTETGEAITRRLEHESGEAKKFYAGLEEAALIGIEATGSTQWFERLVAKLGHELWVGGPAEIRARAVRRQKTDTRDAEHLLDLLLSKRFARVDLQPLSPKRPQSQVLPQLAAQPVAPKRPRPPQLHLPQLHRHAIQRVGGERTIFRKQAQRAGPLLGFIKYLQPLSPCPPLAVIDLS